MSCINHLAMRLVWLYWPCVHFKTRPLIAIACPQKDPLPISLLYSYFPTSDSPPPRRPPAGEPTEQPPWPWRPRAKFLPQLSARWRWGGGGGGRGRGGDQRRRGLGSSPRRRDGRSPSPHRVRDSVCALRMWSKWRVSASPRLLQRLLSLGAEARWVIDSRDEGPASFIYLARSFFQICSFDFLSQLYFWSGCPFVCRQSWIHSSALSSCSAPLLFR
jgi:hypothetical protein